MSGQSTDKDLDTVTRTRERRKTKQPPLYKVLLHNDDYTTMEFVIFVLQSVFHHDQTKATEITLHIHRKGIGVAGVYSFEIAETRVRQVHDLAREYEFPLRSSLEEA